MTEFSQIIFKKGNFEWQGQSHFALMHNFANFDDGQIVHLAESFAVRVLFRQPTCCFYTDQWVVMRESFQARLLSFIYKSWGKIALRLGKLEASIYGVKEGDLFPKYAITACISGLLYKPFTR